ncbi:MAG: hypothetical protein IKM39_04135 [Clostridia bacterium]|nr:hypothetical protein [Clostridia bacterium]
MKLHKRFLSVLLAVVVLATAVNFAPVTEVLATGGFGLYEGYRTQHNLMSQGHWKNNASLTYENDGEYSSTVAKMDRVNSAADDAANDPAIKTRHVTVFHDCKTNANRNNHYLITLNSSKTNRGNPFTTVDNCNGVADDHDAPYTVAVDANATVSMGTASNDVKIRPTQVTDGGDDMVFMFRNYYNTDYTSYGNPSSGTAEQKTQNTSPAGKEGLDISEYDYFEFDFKVDSALGFTKSRNVSDLPDLYTVYFYYETNNGSESYVQSASGSNRIPAAIDGCDWNRLRFDNRTTVTGPDDPNYDPDRLNFDANGNCVDDLTKWNTIRIPLSSLKDDGYKTPTVKQVSIRIVGGWKANAGYFYFDDLRFVKNDDHVGMAYTDKAKAIDSAYAGGAQYPSGEYFMINDFEYTTDSGTSLSTSGQLQEGQVRPFTLTTTDSTVPSYNAVCRAEEHRTDDAIKAVPTSGVNWSDSSAAAKYYVAAPGIVTQGNYGTVLAVRSKTYYGKAEGWDLPAYYQREYTNTMDLSKYTHFAIDIYIRESWPIPKASGVTASGVTFYLEVFDKDTTIENFIGTKNITLDGTPVSTSSLKFNHRDAWGVKFELPFGKECWASGKEDTKGYGQIIPLDTYVNAKSGYTACGGMRLIFTLEDLLEGAGTYFPTQDDYQGKGFSTAVDHNKLKEIDGMKFVWLNDASRSEYNAYVNGNVDIFLDNFIAYTPTTSITIENKVKDTSLLDGDQYFVYDVSAGYRAANTSQFIGTELGNVALNGIYDGVNDPFTKDTVNTTVSVPANGKVTISDVPFNSFYITQQPWGWRYQVTNITSNDPFADESKKKLLKTYVSGSNTASVLPRVGLSGNANYCHSVSILQMLKQRNFTVTFENTAKTTKWLDGGHTRPNDYN